MVLTKIYKMTFEIKNTRAVTFFDDADVDLSGFESTPGRKAVAKEHIKSVAEASGFVSRELEPIPQSPDVENAVDPRRRAGRNEQFNLKVTKEAKAAFYGIADKHGMVLGDVFKQAVQALSRKFDN